MRLRNPVHVAILCSMHGSKSQDEIVQELSDRHRPEIIYFAIRSLLDRGILVESATTTAPEPEELAFWDSAGVNAKDFASTLGESSVSVSTIGHTRKAARDIVACLERSAIAVTDSHGDLAVTVVDDYLNASLREVADRYRRAERVWLPVKPVGETIWIGPLIEPSTSPCWTCIVARLRHNSRRHESLLENRGKLIQRGRRGSLSATRELAGAIVATTLIGFLAKQTEHDPNFKAIASFNPLTLNSRRHVVRPVRGCPECAGMRETVSAGGILADVIGRHPDAALLALADDLTGIVQWPRTLPAGTDSPVRVASAPQPLPEDDADDETFESNADAAFGKGWTVREAELSCIGEAVERYSAAWRGSASVLRSALVDLVEPALTPGDLLAFSGFQYRSRERWNARHGGTAWVPEQFDAGVPIFWTPVPSLVDERRVYVPSAYCYFGRFDPVAGRYMRADSNGCAAGRSPSDAIARALLELIERDAVAIWWYNRTRRPALDIDAAHAPGISEIRDWARRVGREVVVLDVTTDIPVPTYVALSWDTAKGGDIVLGSAADLNPVVATARALMEMCQLHTIFQAGLAATGPFSPTETPTRKMALEWHRERTIESEPYVVPRGKVSLPHGAGSSSTDRDDTADSLLAILRQQGLHAYGLDMTHPDVGIPVARAIVPGLRHFWARFGPGRLYDVPVALGWRDRPIAEADLNPIPLFI